MANDALSIKAELKDSQAVAGAKRIKVSLEDVKRADNQLNWDGVKKGGDAATQSQGKFTALTVALGNLAAQGVSAAISKCKELAAEVVEIGSGFETSMSKVGALSGATGDELGQLEAKARELGASTTFSASQAADALGYMALAGWDTQQMLDGVGSALTLAQAGEMDLAAASDLLTDYLSAFNMEASEAGRMSDVLAYAQANANTTVEGLGMAFKNCAANANAAGMDIETTSAAIAMMANQGLKGSEAGTALNAVLRDMTAKMEDGAIAIGEQSIAVMDAQGNYRDFAAILADVEAATNGMGDAEKAAALQSTFTADSINGLNLLLNAGADEMSSFRDELYNCAGTAEATAAVMTDNLGGDLAAMNSAFEELAIKIYEGLQEPLRNATQFVSGTVVPMLTTLVQNIDKVAPALGAIAGGIALIKAKGAIFDPLIKSARSFTDGLIKCKTVTSAAGTTLIRFNTQTGKVTTQLYASAAAAKAQANQVKVSEVAMKAGSVAAKTMGNALKTIAPLAAMAILVEVITTISGALEDAREHAEAYEKATTELESAHTAFYSSLANGAKAIENAEKSAEQYAMSLSDVQGEVNGVLEGNAQLANSLKDIYTEAGTSVGELDTYRCTIEKLAGESGLSAEDVARLEIAVAGVNEKCGTQYSVVKDAAGAYQVMADGAVVAKDAVLDVIEAQKLQIQFDANKEAWGEAYKKQAEAAKVAADAQATFNEKAKEYEEYCNRADVGTIQWALSGGALTKEYQDAKQALDEANGALDACTNAMDQASDSATLLQMAQNAQADSAIRVIAENMNIPAAFDSASKSSLSFAQDMEAVGASGQALADMTPAQAAAVAEAYDGTFESVSGLLSDYGVTVDEAKVTTQNALEAMSLSLVDIGEISDVELSELQNNFDGSLQSVAKTCLEQGRGIPQSLANGIMESSGAPKASQQLVLDAMVLQLTDGDVDAAAKALGHDIDQGLVDGITGNADMPAEAVGVMSDEVIAKAKETFDSNSPSKVMHQLGTDVDQGLADGIGENADAATDSMTEVAEGVTEAIAGLPDDLKTTGSQSGSGFTSRLGSYRGASNSAAAGLRSQAQSGLSPIVGILGTLGGNAGSNFSGGLSGKADAARTSGVTVGNRAKNGLGSVKTNTVGEQFGRGFTSGMGGVNVWQAAYNVGQSALGAIKSALGIASPSKEARKLGSFFVDGLVLEMDARTSDVEDMADRLGKAMLVEPPQIASLGLPDIPPIGIDWYATSGNYVGPSMLGLESARPSTSAIPGAGPTDTTDLKNIAALLRALYKDLGSIIAASTPDAIKIDEREFGRLVRNVPR